MFSELLDRVLHETPGAVSVTLMGFDGIAIETRESAGAAGGPVNWTNAAIELGAVASQLRRVAEGIGAGNVNEVMVQTGALTTVLRPLNEDYFLALSLTPDGNFGKGRFLMRIVGPRLVAELA